MADQAFVPPLPSVPDSAVNIADLKRLDLLATQKKIIPVQNLLLQSKDVLERLVSPNSFDESTQLGTQLRDPLLLDNNAEKRYALYFEPQHRSLLKNLGENNLYLGDIAQLLPDIVSWLKSEYGSNDKSVFDRLQNRYAQQNLISQEKKTVDGQEVVYESQLFALRYELLKQVNSVLEIVKKITEPGITTLESSDPEILELTDSLKQVATWTDLLSLWQQGAGIKTKLSAAIPNSATFSAQDITLLARLTTNVVRQLIFSTGIFDLIASSTRSKLSIILRASEEIFNFDSLYTKEKTAGFISYIDQVLVDVSVSEKQIKDALSTPSETGSTRDIPASKEVAESNVPTKELLNSLQIDRWNSLSQDKQVSVTHKTLGLHVGFLQNQIANQLFAFYGIPLAGSAFYLLPPLLRYQLNHDLLVQLSQLSPLELQRLSLNRLSWGETFFQHLLTTDPTFLVRFEVFLSQYLTQIPPETLNSWREQGIPIDEILERLNRDVHNSQTTLRNSVATAQAVFQNHTTDQEPPESLVESLMLLYSTGFLSQNLAESQAFFSETLSLLGLGAHEVLDLQLRIGDGIANHEEPKLFLRLLSQITPVKNLTPDKRQLFLISSENFWYKQLGFLISNTEKPLIGAVVGATPNAQNTELLLKNISDLDPTPSQLDKTSPSGLDLSDPAIISMLERLSARSSLISNNDDLDSLVLLLAQHFPASELKLDSTKILIQKLWLPLVEKDPQSSQLIAAKYQQLQELNQQLVDSTNLSVTEHLTKRQQQYYRAQISVIHTSKEIGKIQTSFVPETKATIVSIKQQRLKKNEFFGAPIWVRKRDQLNNSFPETKLIEPFVAMSIAGDLLQTELQAELQTEQLPSVLQNGLNLQQSISNPDSSVVYFPKEQGQEFVQERLSQNRPLLSQSIDTIQNFRSWGKKTQQAKNAISKTKFFTKTITRIKKVADDTKAVLQIGKIFGTIKFLLDALISAITTIIPLAIAGITALAGVIFSVIGSPVVLVGAGITAGILGVSKIIQSLTGQTAAAETIASSSGAATQPNSFLKSAANNVTAQASSSAGVGVIGTAGVCVASAVITITTQGAFLNPLPTLGTNDYISEYVVIEKGINGGTRFDIPTDITYSVRIRAQEGYVVTLLDTPTDTITITVNTEANPQAITTPPASESYSDFVSSLESFITENPQIGQEFVNVGSYSLNFSENPAQYDATNINNVFAIRFEVRDLSGNLISDSETASGAQSICFGECPQVQEGCWPVSGRVSQIPYIGTTHAARSESNPLGLLQDAYDISAPVGTKVYAPFSGRACWGSLDTRYGEHVIMEVPTTYEGASGTMYLIFAHLDSIDAGITNAPSQCAQISETQLSSPNGFLLGRVGNTGNSYGPHLHYESRWNTLAVSGKVIPSLIEGHVPNGVGVSVGLPVRSCHE